MKNILSIIFSFSFWVVAGSISIDGVLEPVEWQNALSSTPFIRYRQEETEAQRTTRGWIKPDRDGLNIAFQAALLPGEAAILKQFSEKKNNEFEYEGGDNFEILLSIDPNQKSLFHFIISSNGQTWTRIAGVSSLHSGEFDWPAAVKITETTISVEARIPWSIFHLDSPVRDEWRVNLCRSSMYPGVVSEDRHSSWHPVATAFADVKTFGTFPLPASLLAPYAGIMVKLDGGKLLISDRQQRKLTVKITGRQDETPLQWCEEIDFAKQPILQKELPSARNRQIIVTLSLSDGTILYRGIDELTDATLHYQSSTGVL